jgi:hypothetical protein
MKNITVAIWCYLEYFQVDWITRKIFHSKLISKKDSIFIGIFRLPKTGAMNLNLSFCQYLLKLR